MKWIPGDETYTVKCPHCGADDLFPAIEGSGQGVTFCHHCGGVGQIDSAHFAVFVADRFLRRKATISELRAAVKAARGE